MNLPETRIIRRRAGTEVFFVNAGAALKLNYRLKNTVIVAITCVIKVAHAAYNGF